MSKETSIVTTPKRCSMVPVFILGSIMLFHPFGFLISLPETLRHTNLKDQYFCWVYETISVYIAYHVLGLSLTGTAIYLMWRLASAGRRLGYALACVAIFSMFIVIAIANVSTCWQ